MALPGIHSYYNVPIYESGNVNKNEAAGTDKALESAAAQTKDAPPEENTPEENPAPKTSEPSQFTFDFKKSNPFHLIAATSPVEDIDVEKALSEMKKDAVLEPYKYFVNPANLGTDQDGTVRIKNMTKK